MKKVIIGVIMMLFMINNSYAYRDISEEYWGYDAIKTLSEREIVSGYPDGTFRPDKNITRAEFITILLKIIQPNADVSSDTEYWADGRIRLAKAKNILVEEDYSRFEPDKDITRREICLMLYRSIPELKEIEINRLDKTVFRDIDLNNHEEIKVARVLSDLGILSGYPDGSLRLGNFSSRAETCSFMNNFMKARCTLFSAIHDNEVNIYENDIAIVKKNVLPKELKKWRYSEDIPYLTTEIKEIELFPFNNPPDRYKELFAEFYNSGSPYLSYRGKFGENNYVIGINFETTNNTYDSELYGGYEFLRLSFPKEDINIIDSFDTAEIRRQTSGNANVGEKIMPGETLDTSAFYVVNTLPKQQIRLDRDITESFGTSFHSLIVDLEGR